MAHEYVYFSNGNYERRSPKLRMKLRNAEFYLKGATVIYRAQFHPLGARLPELASKIEILDCPHLFNSDHRSTLSTDYSSGEL